MRVYLLRGLELNIERAGASADVDVEDELILAMRKDIERALAQEGCSIVYAGGNLTDEVADRQRRERTLANLVVSSVRTERLYFVVRSAIMSLISALVALFVVWYLGTIGVAQAVFLGIFSFIISLFVSRLFDRQVVKLSTRIVRFLKSHKRARAFVLKKL